MSVPETPRCRSSRSPISCRSIAGLLLLSFGASAFAASPSPPGNLRHAVYSDTAAEIFWDRAQDDGTVVSYEVRFNDEIVATRDALSHFSDDLVPGTRYDVAVVSIDDEGERSAPATTSFVGGDRSTPDTPPPDDTPSDDAPSDDAPSAAVAAPSGLRASVYSSRSAEIFWDRPDTFGLSYEVSRNGAVVATTDGVSHYDDDLAPATTYTYEVVAIDSQGRRSAPSGIMLDTPAAGGAVPPSAGGGGGGAPDPAIPPAAGNALIDEPSDLFQRDGYGTVDVIRVDIRTETTPGTCTADDESGCTLADVIADTDKTDDHTVDIAIHFRADDFPDDGSVSNAELRQRGGGSRFAPQKSFRIRLDSREVLWRDERHLQLNKHPFESSRIRNKLAMDVMSEIPNLPSLRTQFVNLWIDDGAGPEDYGLFTHVERVNGRFLDKRGWDDDGNLYKAEHFKFDRNNLDDIRVDEDGEPLDEDRFESALEIENGDDHRALEAMMTALHDPGRSFRSVLDQYFDWDNVMAWVATNILLHQADAVRHNFILYNPTGTEKFFFLPWDYDAAMGLWREPPNDLENDSLRQRVEYGYAVAARNPFLESFYRLPGIHEEILRRAEFLRQNHVTDAMMEERVNHYINLVAPYQQRPPDSEHNPHFSVWSAEKFISAPGENEEALRSRFGVLMAPVLDNPELQGSQWRFSWQPAFDVVGRGGAITYRMQIATSPGFEPDSVQVDIDGIGNASGTVVQNVDAARLRSGDHYVRLIARPANEPERNWQISGNKLFIDDKVYYGPVSFRVP